MKELYRYRINLNQSGLDELSVLVNVNYRLVYHLHYRSGSDDQPTITTIEISGEEFDRLLRVAKHLTEPGR